METMMPSYFIARLISNFFLFGSIVFAIQSPQIVDHPTDVTTVAGRDVTLTCVVENLPIEDDLVQWTKDGFALGYDRAIPGFKSYSMIGDESIGEYDLLIRNSSLQDEGEYECQVRLDRMRTKARVTILILPQGPMIERAEDDVVNVLAYSLNFVTCKSWGGKPAGKLAWFKSGVKMEENVTYADSQDAGKLRNSSATLRIWPTEEDNGEIYQCVMTTDESFREAGEIGHASTSMVKVNVHRPPVASLTTSPAEVEEGGNLFARCEVFDSKPPPTSFKWYVDGKILDGKSDSTITIRDVNKTWNAAVLGCRAVNDLGESEISTVTLNVLYGPVLFHAPLDVVTNSSATTTLSCAWESNPPALITWYKRGDHSKIIGQGEELRIQVEDQTSAGVYVCVANVRGVAKKSATARVDVLGPPIFNPPSIQKAAIGGRATLNCTIESIPGIEHVAWSFIREGSVVSLVNNETFYHAGKMKYAGVMVHGRDTASLIVSDVTVKDMTRYNCTVRNSYGWKTTSLSLEEQAADAMSAEVTMIAAIVGGVVLLVFIVLLALLCVRRNRRRKPSTALPVEKESLNVEQKDAAPKGDSRPDPIPSRVKLISPDADSDNPSTSASVASRDVARDPLEDFRNLGPNDDGYHTEEANSWNRNERQSPPSSPTVGAREDYAPRGYLTPSSPIRPERTASPYASSDMASDVAGPSYLRYTAQRLHQQSYGPYAMQYAPSGVVELPPVARTVSPLHASAYEAPPSQQPPPYYQGPSSSGYRGPPGFHQMGPYRARAGSNAPSVASSHRSVAPSPYPLGRATPTSVLSDRAMYPVSAAAQPRHVRSSSSQSSLEMAASSSTAQDPYENPGKMSRLSSRLSQASRSQEMLNKPMVTRMATHV